MERCGSCAHAWLRNPTTCALGRLHWPLLVARWRDVGARVRAKLHTSRTMEAYRDALAAAKEQVAKSWPRGLPSFAHNDLSVVWGVGAGLEAFDGATPDDTARVWKDFLLEGSPGTQSLVSALSQNRPTFVCSSRLTAVRALAQRLSKLDRGSLCGQLNCFLLAGTRGVGKSTFIQSLARVVAAAARPTTFVLYINFTSAGVREPAQLLRQALIDRGFADVPPASEFISPLLAYMTEQCVRCFLVIDELQELYTLDVDAARRTFRQLHAIGEYDLPRPIVALVTGSAAVLSALAFATPDYDDAMTAYPCYKKLTSLNDRKYSRLRLTPVIGAAETSRAFTCIASGLPEQQQLLQNGLLVAAAGAGATAAAIEPAALSAGAAAAAAGAVSGGALTSGAGAVAAAATGGAGASSATAAPARPTAWMPGDDLVLGGYVPTDELVELLCARSRGLAAYLHTHVVDADASALSHPMRSAIDTMHGDELLRLLDAWQVSVLASARDPVCAASRFTDASICAFGMPLKPGESARPWYKLMDAGAVFFDDADLARAVHFLHPSDAGTLLLHFGRAAASADELSPAQKLSLIAPQLTSADEENERLVLESLACLSAAGKLSLHDGLVVNDVRHAPTTISLGPPSASVQVAELASAAKRSLFCKEFPDMRGRTA